MAGEAKAAGRGAWRRRGAEAREPRRRRLRGALQAELPAEAWLSGSGKGLLVLADPAFRPEFSSAETEPARGPGALSEPEIRGCFCVPRRS